MNAPRTYDGPGIAEVAEMLASKAEAFCRDHLRGGVKQGPRWMAGDVHGNPGGRLSVLLSGAKAGRWKDFAADVQGDLIDLLCHNKGLNKGEAFVEAKRWLGISEKTGHASIARHAEAREERRLEQAKAVTADDQKKQHYITVLRRQAHTAENTVVHAYLRGRGIMLAPPAACLLLPLHDHKPSDRQYPCMLSLVYAPRMEDGAAETVWKVVAIHRTWLVADALEARFAEGKFTLHHHVLALGPDAAVKRLKFQHGGHDTGKMAYGPMKGGFIPLTRSPLRSTLAITEGIENGLSVAQAKPEWSVWAAYSASNFSNLVIPPAVTRLVLCGDSDSKPAKDAQGNVRLKEDGTELKPADEALARAAQLHADVAADAGRPLQVEIWRPAPGKDANDMLREGTL